MKREFQLTQDGSHTLFVPELNEHYHSTHGAVREAIHVYINAGLRQCTKDEIHLLEIGFGTGLNAFLTLLESEKIDKRVIYTSLELYPISLEEAEKLNYAAHICPDRAADFLQLHEVEWGRRVEINNRFSLLKLNGDVTNQEFLTSLGTFDVIYFDAFAPEKQPEMWSKEVFESLLSICNPNAVLTTYCAKGVIRRLLQEVGFVVERLQGPPGKREMLRGRG